MEKIKQLHKRLEHSGKDLPVFEAVTTLLRSPDDIDLQINALGIAHLENWLPNRKRVFWDTFNIRDQTWTKQCVNRIIQAKGDKFAACSLLNSDVLLTLREVQRHSPDFVMVWDVQGGKTCGIGLAKYRRKRLDNYFYVGWKPDEENETVVRIDYISSILFPRGTKERYLNRIEGDCRIQNAFWAELPYRFGYRESALRSFEHPEYYRKPFGVTKKIQQQLGLQWKAT
jgi:hypothetical protein